jgi:2,4-dienoyl-CoA reductase (NADPH2)
LEDLSRRGIKTRTVSKALAITPAGVKLEKNGQVEELPADTVVLAVGAGSHHPLKEVLEKKAIPHQIAGDAHAVGLAFDAVHQGFAAGRSIT